MKTSIIGFPRVGSLRELKFATEKYFKKEISSEELERTAKELRLQNLKIEKSRDWTLYRQTIFLFMILHLMLRYC